MVLRADGGGEAPLLPRAAATAAWRSFFLRLSSAPRLELSGRRDVEGGERLVGRLLWELPPAPPEEVCLLLREREEERREEEYNSGDLLLERPERLQKKDIKNTISIPIASSLSQKSEENSVLWTLRKTLKRKNRFSSG